MGSSHLLYGSSKILISLRKIELINQHRYKGEEIIELDAKKASSSEIAESFSFGLFDTNKKYIVVQNPSKLKDLEKYISEAGNNYHLLLIQQGNVTKKLSKVKKKQMFEEPPQLYKKSEWASSIFQKMVKGEGKTISKGLSDAVISRVGYDIGALRWELKKILQVSEGEEITPQEVSLVISPLQEISGMMVVDAIYSNNPCYFLKVMKRLEDTMRYKNMKSFTEGLLFISLFESYLVCLCLGKSLTPEEIASKLGKNDWVVRNKIIPKARNLGVNKTKKMLSVLYEMERKVNFDGFDPLSYFKSGILSVMVS